MRAPLCAGLPLLVPVQAALATPSPTPPLQNVQISASCKWGWRTVSGLHTAGPVRGLYLPPPPPPACCVSLALLPPPRRRRVSLFVHRPSAKRRCVHPSPSPPLTLSGPPPAAVCTDCSTTTTTRQSTRSWRSCSRGKRGTSPISETYCTQLVTIWGVANCTQ